VLFVLFFRRGATVWQAELLLAVYGLAVALTATLVPAMTRRIGPRNMIVGGEFFKAAGLILLGAVPLLPVEALGQLLNGLGFAMGTGTDSSLLFALEPDRARRARFQATSQSWMFISVLGAGAVGAVIFTARSYAVCYASAAAALAALLLIWGVGPASQAPAAQAAPPQMAATGGTAPARPPGRRWWGGLAAEQLWWAVYYVVGRVATLAPFVGFLPYMLVVRLHVKLGYFGVVLGLFTLSAFVSARYAPGLLRRYQPRALTAAGFLGTVAAIVLFSLAQASLPAVLVGITLLGLASGGVRPVALAGLDAAGLEPSRVGPLVGRLEQATGVANAVILAAGGAVLATSFRSLMLVFAVVLLVCSVTMLAVYRRAVRRDQSPALPARQLQ
jgi:predicted MFS family arabinose efflux permease